MDHPENNVDNIKITEKEFNNPNKIQNLCIIFQKKLKIKLESVQANKEYVKVTETINIFC